MLRKTTKEEGLDKGKEESPVASFSLGKEITSGNSSGSRLAAKAAIPVAALFNLWTGMPAQLELESLGGPGAAQSSFCLLGALP